MTRKRYDDNSTEFGLWIRGDKVAFKEKTGNDMATNVLSIASRKNRSGGGFYATNIDFVWMNYLGNDIMLVEEKRHGGKIKSIQKEAFDIVDCALRFACDSGCLFPRLRDERGRQKRCEREMNYHGFHTLIFQNTNPEDGWMRLDGKFITISKLLKFLRFEKTATP